MALNLDAFAPIGTTLNTSSATGATFEIVDDAEGYRAVFDLGKLPQDPTAAELDKIATEAGFDLGDYEVDPESVKRIGGSQVSAISNRETGEWSTTWNRNFRFALRRKLDAHGVAYRADVDELVKQIRGRKPVKAKPSATDAAFVIAISDLQIGKARERRGGTPETIARFQAAFEFKVAELKRLKPSIVVLAGTGDVVEGCTGFHNEPGRVDLNHREQMRTASQIYMWAVDQVVALGFVSRVVVLGVPSNHGENRQVKGVSMTDPWRDNKDLQLLDRLSEVWRSNPDRYGHVEVIEPHDDFPEGVLVDLDGKRLFCHHGHMMSAGKKESATNRLGVVRGWWQAAGHNGRSVAAADMMLVGHGHEFQISDSVKPIVQAPAGDGGSEWFSLRTGTDSPPGLLSFLFGVSADPSGVRCWSNMLVH